LIDLLPLLQVSANNLAVGIMSNVEQIAGMLLNVLGLLLSHSLNHQEMILLHPNGCSYYS
jgi:hypothetical protein